MTDNTKAVTPEKKLTDDRKDVAAKGDEGLVRVVKGEEHLLIHPTTLHEHLKAGWHSVK